MELFTALVTILQIFAISLGVGASTLAVLNFFAAIADGKIDDTERRMMGIVYKVLRIAMVVIVLSTIVLVALEMTTTGLTRLSVTSYAIMLVLAVLFLNATLMTKHLMPSTFGPAIQAGSWYALGMIIALINVGLINFSFIVFVLGYIAWLVLAIAIINSGMAFLRARKHDILS